MCRFSLDFTKISCFISKIIVSKVVLKYQVSVLTSPSFHPAYPKINFRILRTLNPLSQLHTNRKFEKYISVSICHCHRASFMRSFFIAFKNDESCHFVAPIGSPIQLKLLSGVSGSGFLQPLVINTTSLVHFGKDLSYILSPLAS